MSSAARNLLKTTPHDKKNFPATNQAHFCWQKYNEFVLCLKKNDGDEDTCKPARALALSICPEEWYTAWDEQREAGNFLGIQERPIEKEDSHH
ncbi:cytochrome c oxidase, subunit VIb [Ochromonadaceae sp. CCMP2298]|nr:cytochrome c oxidase, subunit VIb [Ochromonadaceae sp. CCMP2298]|mmetsp:Transcript_15025/g.33145  ORF Transcript_15025/g.33145 Transcript_15025/m.33145 type:complete len:93 (-) Transcript_15025:204-482(-)|eukprot:CAMPEP_0173179404 /NCGR_PEP_ID=MMETSP1141-20130122/6093_1 /TAXON_ID=483371 /ORGANISM="non described non described, Strain CCMP2298" /LENGTH=92 /DNA_ID=CAMNT_0014102043 /DNA_START=69 /DNA_END=347 /DNA_ORIENTATION=-